MQLKPQKSYLYFTNLQAMKKALLLLAFFCLQVSLIFAQSSATTCITATPFCASSSITFPSSTGGLPAEAGPDYGCLGSQPNPAWFYFKIASPGDIVIDIQQYAISGGAGVDVDYIIWGPFTSPTAPCSGGLTTATIESCSYSSTYTEVGTVTGALAGEYYILMITNFSNVPANVTFTVSSASTGTISCAETCVTNAYYNQPLCVGGTLQLLATNHLGLGSYAWTGPAGFSSTVQNPTISGVSGIETGYYYLNYVRDSSCNVTDSIWVQVDTCGTLTGSVFADNNTNCINDSSESLVGNVELKLSNTGGVAYYAWTDVFGFYYFDVPPGPYTLEVVPDPSFPVSCPGSVAHATTVTASSITTENFAIDCNMIDAAAVGTSVSGIAFFPGQTHTMYPHVISVGPECSVVPCEVSMVLDPLVHYTAPAAGAPAPSAVITAAGGDTLKWNVSDLNSLSYFGYSDFAFQYITDVSATIGDTVTFVLSVTPSTPDSDTSNNTDIRRYEVGNSYDPNSKEVLPRGDGPAGFIPAATPLLEYTINFQNMGTAPAHNIYILDTLDANVDISTLSIISSSHMQTTTLTGNVLKFNFSNIMLADSASNESASHGFVKYSIAPVTGLNPGDQIENTAYIYFDFNPAVITNTAVNTIEFPLGITETGDYHLGVFPNPTNGLMNIVFEDKESRTVSIKLTNISGQVIWREGSTSFNGKYERAISLETHSKGVYMLEIATDKQVVHKKIIKN
jgi:uncharacterized repeat protein (TIGR01451 family)